MLKFVRRDGKLMYFETKEGEKFCCYAEKDCLTVIVNIFDDTPVIAEFLEKVFSQKEIFPEEFPKLRAAWFIRISHRDFDYYMPKEKVTAEYILELYKRHEQWCEETALPRG